MNLNNNSISDINIYELANALIKSKLKALSLQFADNRFSDNGFANLSMLLSS